MHAMKKGPASFRTVVTATAGLFLCAAPLRADHYPSAQELLGSAWWGIALMGVVALGFVGGMVTVVVKVIRAESELESSDGREGGPNPPEDGPSPNGRRRPDQ